MTAQNLNELLSKHLWVGPFPVNLTAVTASEKNMEMKENKIRDRVLYLILIVKP